MTTSKTKKAATTAKQATTKAATPVKAIGDAAVGLEHNIAAALRQEVKHLKTTMVTIQKDVRSALARVEAALEAAVEAKPPAKKADTKKAVTKKPAAKKAVAKKGRSK